MLGVREGICVTFSFPIWLSRDCLSEDFSVSSWVGVTRCDFLGMAAWRHDDAWRSNTGPHMGNCETLRSSHHPNISMWFFQSFFDFNFAKIARIMFFGGKKFANQKNRANSRILQHFPDFLSNCWGYLEVKFRNLYECCFIFFRGLFSFCFPGFMVGECDCLQRNPVKPNEQWPKPVLFAVYRGLYYPVI